MKGAQSLNVCIVGTHKFHYFRCLLLPQMLIYILIQFPFICTLSFFMLARINRQTTFSQPIVSTDGCLGIKTVQLLVLCFYPPLHFMLHQIRKQSRSPPGLRIVDTEICHYCNFPLNTQICIWNFTHSNLE